MGLLESIEKDKLLIIDGNSLAFRAFYALPPLSNFEGVVSNAVFGFCNMLVKAIEEIKPKYIAVAFDYGKKTFRNEMYEDYKGNRKETPVDLKLQFPILKEILKAMNISTIEIKGYEADDIIGSLTKLYDVHNIILTGDRDSLQLINSNTYVMLTKKGISETRLYDTKNLMEDFGVEPYQVIEMKAIMGDASDNIPGIKGIGEKGALNLISTYATLDNIYENIDELKGKTKEYLVNQKDIAYLSKALATIDTNVNLNLDLNSLTYDFPFNENVMTYFKKYQFNSLLKRKDIFLESAFDRVLELNKNEDIKIEDVSDIAKLTKAVEVLCKESEVALYIDDTVVSLSANNTEYNLKFGVDLFSESLTYEQVFKVLEPLLIDKKINKVVFDSKPLMHTLYKYGFRIEQINFDVMLGRYLVNQNAKINATIVDVANEFMLDETKYASNIMAVYRLLSAKLKDLDLFKLYYDIELPLVNVLFNMEIQGVKLDRQYLLELDAKYEQEINGLVNEIYELAGKEFNINSPKQLADILFVDLGIKAYNNKKNSTKVEVLNEIVDKHPIVPAIIKYRQIYKLYTTYIKAYKELINDNDKIYTMFNQLVTATGRLSSSEPNLQNIPVRSEEGAKLRGLFISSFDGGKITGADYSQIELRLLAHLSGDDNLINAYKLGEDIHAITASEIFGIPLHEVTSDMRRSAKAINFGIVYGISDYGLSQNINTSVQTANEYIKKYFERYPLVKQYMDDNVAYAKKNGYIKTMYGRIRNMPDINSSNYNIRQFNERAAMNMPLQGSASDIIKLAMIRVFNELDRQNLKSRLILQVHDELIVDTAPEEVEIVKNILENCMQNVASLKVPLIVNVAQGDSWKDAK